MLDQLKKKVWKLFGPIYGSKGLREARAALRAQCCTFPLSAWIVMCNMMMQTIGKSVRASILAMARQGLFFVPAVLILPRLFGLFGVQISQAVADVISFLVAIPLQMSVFRAMDAETVGQLAP